MGSSWLQFFYFRLVPAVGAPAPGSTRTSVPSAQESKDHYLLRLYLACPRKQGAGTALYGMLRKMLSPCGATLRLEARPSRDSLAGRPRLWEGGGAGGSPRPTTGRFAVSAVPWERRCARRFRRLSSTHEVKPT